MEGETFKEILLYKTCLQIFRTRDVGIPKYGNTL